MRLFWNCSALVLLVVVGLVLLSPALSHAQSSRNLCWSSYSSLLSDCLKQSTGCISGCVDSNPGDQDGFKNCSSGCQSAGDGCRTQAGGGYSACIEQMRGGSDNGSQGVAVEEELDTETSEETEVDDESSISNVDKKTTPLLLPFELLSQAIRNAFIGVVDQAADPYSSSLENPTTPLEVGYKQDYNQYLNDIRNPGIDQQTFSQVLKEANNSNSSYSVSSFNEYEPNTIMYETGPDSGWMDLKPGDAIPEGAWVYSVEPVIIGVKNLGVIELSPNTFVEFTGEGFAGAQDRGAINDGMYLHEGEVEIMVDPVIIPSENYNPDTGEYRYQGRTTNVVAGVKGTHFWMTYSRETNTTNLGVYEGEVEVIRKGDKNVQLVIESQTISAVGQKRNFKSLSLYVFISIIAVMVAVVLKIKRNKKKK